MTNQIFLSAILTFCLIPHVASMEDKKTPFPREIITYLHSQRCSNHNHSTVNLKTADERPLHEQKFSFPLCALHARTAGYFKKKFDLDDAQQKYTYIFDVSISPLAAFLTAAYMACMSSPKACSYKSSIEKTIIDDYSLTHNFDLFAQVLAAAQTLQIHTLTEALNNYLFTTLTQPHSAELEHDLARSWEKEKKYIPDLMDTTQSPYTIREQGALHTMLISPDTTLIVTTHSSKCSQKIVVSIYDHDTPTTPRVTWKLPSEDARLSWSPDGTLLCEQTSHNVCFYAAQDLKQCTQKPQPVASIGHWHGFLQSNFSNDGKLCIITTRNGHGLVYDCATFTLIQTIDFGCKVYDQPLFCKSNKHVIVALDSECALFCIESGKKTWTQKLNFPINSLYLSPDEEQLVILAEPLCLFVNVNKPHEQSNIKTDLFNLTKIAFSHDSSSCAVTSNKTCYLYKKNEKRPHKYYSCKKDIIDVVFNPRNPYLMLSDGAVCTLYDYEKDEKIFTVSTGCIAGARVRFSHDGSAFVITCKKTGKIYTTAPLYNVLETIKK